ncbi:MAG TPA: rhomboid family intramembrane serine protease [Rhodanobacteraceae bacterium]|nr:rhomboid family intramembrane serine protease [Rhodanobacteraceae bacterium]
MFVHVDSRRRRGPRWATLLIVVMCVACFVALSLLPPKQEVAWVMRWGTVPARLFTMTGVWWRNLFNTEWLCLLSSLFIHVAWLHLLTNMLFLVIFGLPAERALGPRRFLGLFLLAGVFANLVGALTLAAAHAPIIGCSGAVSAVVGVYLVLFPHARLGLVLPLGLFMEFVRVPASLLIGLWVLLQLLFTYAGPGFGAVAWWSHIAGFGFGVLFAVLSRRAVERRLRG